MNRTVLCCSVLLLALAAPLAAQATDDRPPTAFTLLTGTPDPAAEGGEGVLLVPGAVLPLGAPAGADAVERSLAMAASTAELAERLQETLRLSRVDVQYRVTYALEVDREEELPPAVPGSSLVPRVTLLGRSAELSTYRVTFTDGDRVLSETRVAVPAGRRTVVGGVDGEEAPYLFLVLDSPTAEDEDAIDPDQVTPPRAVVKPAPTYPEDARKEKVEGTVIVRAMIEKDGTVSSAEVVKGVHPSLDRATVETIQTWRFEPALLNGQPVATQYHLTIRYRLPEEDEEGEE